MTAFKLKFDASQPAVTNAKEMALALDDFYQPQVLWHDQMVSAMVRNVTLKGMTFAEVEVYVRKDDDVVLAKQLVNGRKKNPVKVHRSRALKMQELFGLQGKVEEFLHVASGGRVLRISNDNVALEAFMFAEQYLQTCK